LQDLGVFAPALAALNDDLNTAEGLGQLFKGLRNATTEGGALTNWMGLHAILAALGLVLSGAPVIDAPPEAVAIAAKRQGARAAKDWETSDRLRDELKELGWIVKDSREGYELEPGK
jgi:cysteinyl-tRNA synthetase